MKRLIVVDDDFSMRSILQEALTNSGYEVKAAKDGNSVLKLLGSEQCDLIISDLMMPGINGIELMDIVRKDYPGTGFLLITAYGTIELAVEALQKGAFDFITKPFSITQIESKVEQYFEYKHLKKENIELKRKLLKKNRFNMLIGQSKTMQQVFQQIDAVAGSDASVFIQGESGTGKELIAQAIHESSERVKQPFLKVNCPAIPETLFESTLFGHEKGSFTNAIQTHVGIFERADGGTILLDEISELPNIMQAKLLRVLQERVITKVGGTKEISIDIRVIATSNKNINRMIEEEKFRPDLFFRLNVFPIKIPPLRARREDIPLLIDHFLKKFQNKYGYEKKEIGIDTQDSLVSYNWPGNVRQIENLVERAILYSGKEQTLTLDHFSLESDSPSINNDFMDESLISIMEMEKKLIFSTLKKTNNNRTQAANILGISVRTLRNKLHRYKYGGSLQV